MMLLDVVILHAGSQRAARGPSALMPRALREEDAPCFGVHECDPSRGGRCRGPRALTGARSMLIELRALDPRTSPLRAAVTRVASVVGRAREEM